MSPSEDIRKHSTRQSIDEKRENELLTPVKHGQSKLLNDSNIATVGDNECVPFESTVDLSAALIPKHQQEVEAEHAVSVQVNEGEMVKDTPKSASIVESDAIQNTSEAVCHVT